MNFEGWVADVRVRRDNALRNADRHKERGFEGLLAAELANCRAMAYENVLEQVTVFQQKWQKEPFTDEEKLEKFLGILRKARAALVTYPISNPSFAHEELRVVLESIEMMTWLIHAQRKPS